MKVLKMQMCIRDRYNTTCDYAGGCDLWQYTASGRIPGIDGNVDMNYLYRIPEMPAPPETPESPDSVCLLYTSRCV